ncbi:MAG TPA: hypothetical protein VEH31_39950 [Streptosporangiaceae bacterium]|nr:hypothetical protein [Streptosporangiaceae bacterium]
MRSRLVLLVTLAAGSRAPLAAAGAARSTRWRARMARSNVSDGTAGTVCRPGPAG